jgi:hypothetical protein
MKARIIAVFIIGIFALISCTELLSEEFCNDPNAKCPDTSKINASSCCTDQDCYWTYNGSRYDCDGDDCSDVINTIISSACASATAGIDISVEDYDILRAQLQNVTDKLLLEARGASGCE